MHQVLLLGMFFSLSLFAAGPVENETSVKAVTCSDVLEDSLFLEEVQGQKALDWVRLQNEASVARLKANPKFEEIEEAIYQRSIATDRIQPVSFWDGYLLNFERDATHTRGILRKTDLQSYLSGKPNWEVILDVDKLALDEGENWVYGGSTRDERFPNRALVSLSRGGKDSKVIREFDHSTKSFVANGFQLPEGKHRVSWEDENTLLVGTNLREGDLTESGYPRTVRRWKRGTPLADAPIVFEGDVKDISASGGVFEVTKGNYILNFYRGYDFYHGDMFVLVDGKITKVPLPTDSNWIANLNGLAFVQLKSDWTVDGQTFPSGSIVQLDFLNFLKTGQGVKQFFVPTSHQAVQSIVTTDTALYMTILEDVRSRILKYVPQADGSFKLSDLPIGKMGAASIGSVDDKTGQLFMWYEDYLTPSSLYLYTESTGTLDLIASLPARYDATPYMTEQLWATSKDGTKVPYFVIRKKDFKLDSEHPAWIYGYGGFEISLTPGYLQNVPDFWLKDDGIYVVANIRGGGEFGPEWHKAALLENRQRAFDDFQAVAEDLVKRQYTKPARIGIEGGSNGGLLTGVSVTQRPELFAAAIIDVPLLDMLRYDQLLAGASWVAEYGSPSDPKMHDVLAAYSPLHNLKEGVEYPEVFIKTSTADDRVHPGHARRFAYRMAQLGQDYLYFENIEGGHGGSANKKQSATIGAYEFVYMREKLMEQNTSKK